MLSDEQIEAAYMEAQAGAPYRGVCTKRQIADAIESAACAERDKRIAELQEDLEFVERWAVHHGSNPNTKPQEALSVIQHYPPIKAITLAYKDGKVPDTFDPFKRIAELERELEQARQQMERQKDEWLSWEAKRKALESAVVELEAVRKDSGWQPIETAPKDGTLFLCWVSAVRYGETDEGQPHQHDVSQADFCNWRTQADIPDCGWFEPFCGQIGDSQAVTHWMPLPPAPAMKEQK